MTKHESAAVIQSGGQHQAPLQIYAQLLDEGVYLCSVSTMYRVLRENTQVKDRRRQATHPPRAVPELVATAPRQVFSWDITKLPGPIRGQYFDCYVMIDIYFRYIVGARAQHRVRAARARDDDRGLRRARRAARRARRPRHLDDQQDRRGPARGPGSDQIPLSAPGFE